MNKGKTNNIISNIQQLQNNILDKSLVAFSLLAVLSHTLFVLRSILYGIGAIFYVSNILLVILFTVTYFRKKIKFKYKLFTLVSLIYIILISGLYSYGFLASAKYYVCVAPVFLSFIVTNRKANISLLSLLTIYMIFGILFSTHSLSYNVDIDSYTSSYISWSFEAIIIFFTSWGLLYVGKTFRSELINSYREIENHRNHLQDLIDTKTEILDTTNEELQATNEELYSKNEEIINQNEELTTTIQKLKETQSKLVESEKMASLGVLTAGVAHEINNPLNFILGGYNGLEGYFEENGLKNEQIDTFMDFIKTGVDRSAAIVSGLNQFSRNQEAFDEKCDIHKIIDNCLLILNSQKKELIRIEKNYSAVPVMINGNSGKLHQVFINIISNAYQAIGDMGTLSIKTEIQLNDVKIFISDTGSGISEEIIDNIIEPFFTTKDPGQGTGLGLSISHSIILDHNGTLEFNSKENHGTTVIITFPIEQY